MSANNDRPRLTEQQKKDNHIKSEQKRREAIREAFDKLAVNVPGMEGHGRSEALVLDTATTYLRDLIMKRVQLVEEGKRQGKDLSAYELPQSTVEACMEQLKRNENRQSSNEKVTNSQDEDGSGAVEHVDP